ncbi:MAG: MBL fold metallo-hydrolase [Ruminococcaceae bacterium]|nr:MBL fold metallo-hydrolase [Oscillospiraceae bacterium]
MKLITVNVSDMDVNTYLIESEKTALIIDPGVMCEEIEKFIKDNEGKEIAILLTHNHFDHIGGADLARKLSNGKIYIHVADATGLSNPEINLSSRFGLALEPFEADVAFKENESLNFTDFTVKTMLTPGHSEGSVCYIIDDFMFSGDTLFRMNVGRTDFIFGSRTKQIESLKKLSLLDEDFEVYPGHGPATRLSFEKEYNPYIKEIK